MGNEKYFSEAAIKDSPEKKIKLTIRDGSVVTDKLANGAVTSEKIRDGAVTADKIAKDIVDGIAQKVYNGIYDEIELSDIDLQDSIDDYLNDRKVLNVKIIQKNSGGKRVIGLLQILTDPGSHQLVQILTTSMVPDTIPGGHPFSGHEFDKFSGAHVDGAVYTYCRFYNNCMDDDVGKEIPKGTWSKWRWGNDSWVSGMIATLEQELMHISSTYISTSDAMTHEDIDEILNKTLEEQ